MDQRKRQQFGLLPERKMDWRTLCVSYGVQTLLLLVILMIGILIPEKMGLKHFHATEMVALKPWEAPSPPKIKIKPLHIAKVDIPVPVTPSKLVVPKEMRKPKVEMAEVEAPKFEDKTKLDLIKSNPAMPSVIHTGAFAGSALQPTVAKPVEQVQTGGFGDPNALKGQGKAGAKLVSAQLGSFDLPTGPGQGNGAGGAKGAKGIVASADFGSGIATAGHGGPRGSVQQSGFGAQQPAQHVAKAVTVDAPTTGVEIISKPTPVYTQEARDLKLEGQVLLEILFTADGHVQVQRVVRGLGHGLDEAAIAAAGKMRFKPAMRDGQAVDFTAVVHVVFQMAY